MKPTVSPELQEVAHLEKLRSHLATDIAALHQKEANLREYEHRIRQLMDGVPAEARPGHTTSPFLAQASPASAELDQAWEKYQRAHALLEAARRGLTDDRLALRQREEGMAQREEEIARREAWIKVREAELQAQAAAEVAKPEPKPKKSFTTAPFRAAKNLLTPSRI